MFCFLGSSPTRSSWQAHWVENRRKHISGHNCSALSCHSFSNSSKKVKNSTGWPLLNNYMRLYIQIFQRWTLKVTKTSSPLRTTCRNYFPTLCSTANSQTGLEPLISNLTIRDSSWWLSRYYLESGPMVWALATMIVQGSLVSIGSLDLLPLLLNLSRLDLITSQVGTEEGHIYMATTEYSSSHLVIATLHGL